MFDCFESSNQVWIIITILSGHQKVIGKEGSRQERGSEQETVEGGKNSRENGQPKHLQRNCPR